MSLSKSVSVHGKETALSDNITYGSLDECLLDIIEEKIDHLRSKTVPLPDNKKITKNKHMSTHTKTPVETHVHTDLPVMRLNCLGLRMARQRSRRKRNPLQREASTLDNQFTVDCY